MSRSRRSPGAVAPKPGVLLPPPAPPPTWAAKTAGERANILRRLFESMLEEPDALAELLTRDHPFHRRGGHDCAGQFQRVGPAAYSYTRDHARVWRVAEPIQTGIVGINTGLISTEVARFGGIKQSGLRREGSRQGLEDYMELKYLCMGI